MRAPVAFVLLFVAACGGRSTSPAMRSSDTPVGIEIKLSAADRGKLSPLFAEYIDKRFFRAATYWPVILRGRGIVGDAERADLAKLGGMHLWPVTTSPGRDGNLYATPAEGQSDTVVVHVVGEQVAAAIALPWVIRVEVAGSFPAGPQMSADVAKRIDHELMLALATLGANRLQRVVVYGTIEGCLDAVRRRELEARGASLGSVVDEPACTKSTFSFNAALDQIPAIASLPWIVRLEREPEVHEDHMD